MSNQQDQEYIITKIFNLTDPIMLQELAHMYKYKFHNKPEIKKIIIQYAVSSYTEPECFPQKTPISSIPEIIDSNQLFIHNFIDKLYHDKKLNVLLPSLINEILSKISHIPDHSNFIHYQRLEILLKNRNILLFYTQQLNLHNFETLFKPRLCPDMYNVTILPKDKEELYQLSSTFENLHIKISNILLLFCKCKDTREQMINWLLSFVNRNKSRKKTRPDDNCSSDGVVLNFLSVMLLLCEPFISIYSDKVTKISIEDYNQNFISQCFHITSKMIDYGFLTTLHNFRIYSSRFRDDSDKSYLLDAFLSQMCNKPFINYIKKFILLELYIVNNKRIIEEELIESIWNTVDFLLPFKVIDYEISEYIINYFTDIENITNPHLRAEVGRITSSIILNNPEIIYHSTNKLINSESGYKKRSDILITKLLNLYGNLPNVDTHSKFMCRREISKCIDMVNISNIDNKILSDFVYGVLAETDSLTSNALESLKKIKVKIDKNEEIEQKDKDETTMQFNLANDTLDLLIKLTNIIPKSFKDECAIVKTASSWSCMIHNLIGNQSLKLKVKNPHEFGFNPKELLFKVVTIFNNLKNKELLENIGKIGLLNEQIFTKMIHILNREQIFTPHILSEIKTSLSQINIEIEEEDAPEEFYDAIMGTIMDDPVRLPSDNFVDKTTILQHLKNDTTDPFTRQPLTVDQLVYDSDLKDKIDKWRKTKNV